MKKQILASLNSLKKGVGYGSGSISQRYGSADPQHCRVRTLFIKNLTNYRGVQRSLVHQVQEEALSLCEGEVEAHQDPLLQLVDVGYLIKVPQLIRLHSSQ
jgi:hypothetical protein